MRYFNIILFAVLKGIMILILAGCAIQKEKHFYLEYGQTGYIHTPTIEKDKWMTLEIKAPEYEEVK